MAFFQSQQNYIVFLGVLRKEVAETYHDRFSLPDERHGPIRHMCNESGSRERKAREREKSRRELRCNDWITESPESLGGPLAWPPDIQSRKSLPPSFTSRGFLPSQVISMCSVCIVHTNVRDAPREPIAPCTLAVPHDDALCAIYVNCWTRALVTPARFSSLWARGIDYIGYKTYWDRWNERVTRYRYPRFATRLILFCPDVFLYLFDICRTVIGHALKAISTIISNDHRSI